MRSGAAPTGALGNLSARVVHEERAVVALEHLGERGVLDPLDQAPRHRGPGGRGLAHDPAPFDVNGDVNGLPAVADHQERFLDLETHHLGLEKLERGLVDANGAVALADRRAGDRLLPLAGGQDDDRGLHCRAPRRTVTSPSVVGGRRPGRVLGLCEALRRHALVVGRDAEVDLEPRSSACLPRVLR